MEKDIKYYVLIKDSLGVVAFYKVWDGKAIEYLLVPKTDINILDNIPKDVIEIKKINFDAFYKTWTYWLTVDAMKNPKDKEVYKLVKTSEKFVAKTKYLIKYKKLQLIGYSERPLQELIDFFKDIFEKEIGIVMRDSVGVEIGLIPWNILKYAEYKFNEIE